MLPIDNIQQTDWVACHFVRAGVNILVRAGVPTARVLTGGLPFFTPFHL
jgi:hypothetical protein